MFNYTLNEPDDFNSLITSDSRKEEIKLGKEIGNDKQIYLDF